MPDLITLKNAREIIVREVSDTTKHIDDDSHLFYDIGGRSGVIPLDSSYQNRARNLGESYYYSNFIYNRVINILADFIMRANFRFEVGPSTNNKTATSILDTFYNSHPNYLSRKLPSWIIELLITGELLWVFDVNPVNGRVYVTTVGSKNIKTVKPLASDYRTPGTVYVTEHDGTDNKTVEYQLLRYNSITNRIEGNAFYFSVGNVGDMLRGVPFLTASLDWLNQLQTFMFSKMIGNSFKDSVWIDVELRGKTEEEVKRFLSDRSRRPPVPNSIIAHNEQAKWSILSSSSSSSGSSNIADFFLELSLNCAALTGDIFAGHPERNASEGTNAGLRTIENVQRYLAQCFEVIMMYVLEQAVEKGVLGSRNYTVTCVTDTIGIRDIQRVAGAVARVLPAIMDAAERSLITDTQAQTYINKLMVMLGLEEV
jgi:hypothetical protein